MEMRIQTLPAPEAAMAYAGESSLCARQAQESIFSNSEMLTSRVSVPTSSPEVRLAQNQDFNAAGPGETSQEASSGGKEEGKDYA